MSPPRAYVALEIAAPIDRVWTAMIEMHRYPECNPFVTRVDGVGPAPRVGQPMVLHVRWSNGLTLRSPEQIARIEPPSRSADGVERASLEYVFRGLLDRWGLVRGARLQTVTRLDEGRTRYESEERFTGLLARWVPLASVQNGFERHARALARRVE